MCQVFINLQIHLHFFLHFDFSFMGQLFMDDPISFFVCIFSSLSWKTFLMRTLYFGVVKTNNAVDEVCLKWSCNLCLLISKWPWSPDKVLQNPTRDTSWLNLTFNAKQAMAIRTCLKQFLVHWETEQHPIKNREICARYLLHKSNLNRRMFEL